MCWFPGVSNTGTIHSARSGYVVHEQCIQGEQGRLLDVEHVRGDVKCLAVRPLQSCMGLHEAVQGQLWTEWCCGPS